MPHILGIGEAHELLDEPLAALVRRVGLTRDNQLNRALGVGEQRLEPRRIAKHESQSLVGGHPAREADREHIRIEDRIDPSHLRGRRATIRPRGTKS